jgi:multidrug efflux system membrane fusion protein
MYVYFDVDETTLLRVRKAINEGTVIRYQQGGIPVFISLEGEDNFPHQGMINFVNNRVNSGTGSITVRGVIENPKPDNGIRLLTPGMFVRVRLPIGKPREALLVIDRAIGSDQGLKFLYVVDAGNHVQQRRIQTGPLQEDGLRVITSGLRPDDMVIVGGIQQVRPRMQIVRDVQPMPTLGGSAEDASEHGGKGGAVTPAGEAEQKTKPEESKGAPLGKDDATPTKGEPTGSSKQ